MKNNLYNRILGRKPNKNEINEKINKNKLIKKLQFSEEGIQRENKGFNTSGVDLMFEPVPNHRLPPLPYTITNETPDGETTLYLHVFMRTKNLDKFEKLTQNQTCFATDTGGLSSNFISNINYKITKEQLRNYYGYSINEIQPIIKWLEKWSSIITISELNDMIYVKTTVSQVNQFLRVNCLEINYQPINTTNIISKKEPFIPCRFREMIELIGPLYFPYKQAPIPTQSLNDLCPNVDETQYGKTTSYDEWKETFGILKKLNNIKNADIGLVGANSNISKIDLDAAQKQFQEDYSEDKPKWSETLNNITGIGVNNKIVLTEYSELSTSLQQPSAETTVDLTTAFVVTGGNSQVTLYQDIQFNNLRGEGSAIPLIYSIFSFHETNNQLPYIWSSSFGFENLFPYSSRFLIRLDRAYRLAGLLGYTFFRASGDTKVLALYTNSVTDETPIYTEQLWGSLALPSFINVGGIYNPPELTEYYNVMNSFYFQSNNLNNKLVQPKNLFGSTGGTVWNCKKSNLQKEYWNNFYEDAKNKGLLPDSQISTFGRISPDIMGPGGFNIILYQTINSTFGTSLAAPFVASMFAIINSQRLQNGLSPLGGALLNSLYLTPKIGTNYFSKIVGDNSVRCIKGYTANPELEWDPVGGLGCMDLLSMFNLYGGFSANILNIPAFKYDDI